VLSSLFNPNGMQNNQQVDRQWLVIPSCLLQGQSWHVLRGYTKPVIHNVVQVLVVRRVPHGCLSNVSETLTFTVEW